MSNGCKGRPPREPIEKMKINDHDISRPGEHIRLVKDIFSSIPGRYDLLNHLLSFGEDFRWRRRAVNKMAFAATHRLLDVATGTGDLAIAALRRYPDIKAVGVDFVSQMMNLARHKIERRGLEKRLALIQGDATNLPFPDDTFDVAAIAFGIRNIPDRLQAIKEMTRVVVPGGQVLILEMGFPQRRIGKIFFYPYINFVLPLLSRLLSPNPAAYRYLADSIMTFPSPEEFCKTIRYAGLTQVTFQPLTMGITCLYEGMKK